MVAKIRVRILLTYSIGLPSTVILSHSFALKNVVIQLLIHLYI